MRRTGVVAGLIVAGVVLAGCSGGSDSASEAPTTAATGTSSVPAGASVSPGASAPAAIPATVPGTYSNGDWVVRLAADGTWEEDLRGQKNAYGGTYTVDGDTVLLRDRGGSTETATLQGDELKLPSITLRRQ
ncbi:Atu4866 domain-containing protein [Tsukamurella sp. 1534]|uniref:Atu4866 domain-containing protein n=1 Tax=Tsukamurella sp. 1534 TaxID=1151061 RepID=UPI0011D27A5D|nr:Atu4866 domain-containing protein [Tsukamurella sp. 1534]